ncbi:MAG: DUF4837 family protein [Crocinitomicaceae bacterium]
MMRYFFVSILLFSLFSCDGDIPDNAFLPESSGERGRVLILMEESLWNGPMGDTVQAQLSQRAPGPYLRKEPIFSYYWKKPSEFNHMNQMGRSIIKFIIDDDSTYAETAMIERMDYYAKNQLFLIIKDSDPNRMLAFVQNRMNEVIQRFNDFETNQLIGAYKNDFNKRANEFAEKEFGLSIAIPSGAKIKISSDTFFFAKRDRSRTLQGNEATGIKKGTYWIQQGFLMWKTPVIPDSNQMTLAAMLNHRDSTLKKNLPGEVEGTYMGTEYSEYYEPEGKVFDYNGHQAAEIRGLWIYDGEVFVGGGGPFVQYSILNESRNEIVTVCGYIYAPKFDKREYIREVDAVLQTIDIK